MRSVAAGDAGPVCRRWSRASAGRRRGRPPLRDGRARSPPGLRRTARSSVEPTYGSSGNLLAQISEGAPFDVFFSADAQYPRELEKAGLAASGSTQLYGIGQIVVWVPVDSALDIESRGLEALTDPSVRTVAIANPEHAPYGRAAIAAMKSAGRLRRGRTEARARRERRAGRAVRRIRATPTPASSRSRWPSPRPLEGRGRFAVVPIDSYPALDQGAVVLDGAADPVAARAFLDFVLGPDGRAILDRYGFLLPSPP